MEPLNEYQLLEREIIRLQREVISLGKEVKDMTSAFKDMKQEKESEVKKWRIRFYIALGISCVLAGSIITFLLLAI